MPVLKLARARSPVVLLDGDRRPTSTAVWSVAILVLLAFGVAFVLGSRAPQARVGKAQGAPGGTAQRATGDTARQTTATGSAMTPLRLDPVPALPDLRNAPARTSSPPPAQTAAAPPTTAPAPAFAPRPAAPRPVQPPAASQPVQPPVTPSQPAPAAKPKPSPGGTPFDSSG